MRHTLAIAYDRLGRPAGATPAKRHDFRRDCWPRPARNPSPTHSLRAIRYTRWRGLTRHRCASTMARTVAMTVALQSCDKFRANGEAQMADPFGIRGVALQTRSAARSLETGSLPSPSPG